MKAFNSLKTSLKENALSLLLVAAGLIFMTTPDMPFLGFFLLGFSIGQLWNPASASKRLWHTGLHIARAGCSALLYSSVRKAMKKGTRRA